MRRIGVSSAPMTKSRLIYFDAPVSRGEECRLALHLAGIDFEDVRVKSADWPVMKAQTPYGAVPVLELPGKSALAFQHDPDADRPPPRHAPGGRFRSGAA